MQKVSRLTGAYTVYQRPECLCFNLYKDPKSASATKSLLIPNLNILLNSIKHEQGRSHARKEVTLVSEVACLPVQEGSY